MICQECGMEIESNEYHPHSFCVLIKAGLNPLAVVLEAAKELKLAAPDKAVENGDRAMEPIVCPGRIEHDYCCHDLALPEVCQECGMTLDATG